MATLTVTTIANAGTGSLRETIAAAQSGDTINFAASLANQTIVLASELELPRSITIDGSTAPGLTISGNNAVRVFDVTGTGITVNISNLTIADGRATTGVDEERAGAGIRGASNTVLNVDTVLFENNVAGFAGAIYTGFSSTNTVTNSTFNNNDGTLDASERGGGAIATKSNSSLTVISSTFTNNQGINGGAINHLLGNLTIEDSTFIDNTTTQGTGTNTNGYGGAVYVDGANASGPGFTPGSIGGTIAIRDSVFEGNTGKGQGGGLFLFVYDPDELILEDNVVTNNQVIRAANGDALGGGIRIGNGRYRIENTTFANNIAEAQGGGLWVGGTATGSITNSTFWQNQAINPTNTQDGLGGGLLFATTSPQQVTNVTIASNQAGGEGGGIVGRSNVTLTNTIVANNTGNNPFGNKQNASDGQGFNASPPPIFGDGGGNLQWPAITNNFNDPNITATVVQADPRLGTLTDTGNGVLVVPLLEGSAAIDTGVSTGAPTTDQRGQARPVDGDGNGSAIVDMGAFELSGESVVTEIALTIAPSRFSENGGTATGTLTRNVSSGDLVVNLSSSDTGEATVPATVTIPDGATAATFTVTGVDDTILDGSQSVTIAASAVDLPEAIGTISITDDEQDDSTTPTSTPIFEVDSNDLISEVFAYDFSSVEAGSTVTIRLVDRNFATEDAFDNLVGLYEIADVNGGIDTNNDGVADLFPSDAAYAQYAITNRVEDFELRAGSLGDPAKNTTIAQFGEVVLTAGKRYAPFLLANGGDLGFDGFITAENAETDGVFNDAADFEYDRVLYFPFQAANPDGTAHLKSFGNNALGFEDLGSNIGTSDQDFDDIAFTLGVSIDIPDLPTVSLAVSPTTVLENNTANLIYTFSRTGDTTNPLTVNYSVSGTATFNSDYTQSGATSFNATTGSVTFAAGDSTAIVTIVPREDDLAETSETVAFTLTENPAYTVGTSAPVVGTLTDTTPDTPDNPAPRLEDIQSTALEDTIVSFSLEDFLSAFSDEEDENDNLKAIRVISLPASGSLSLNTTAVTVGQVIQSTTLSQLRYTPATDRNGDITFQVSAQDDGIGNIESTPATVTIALTAVNDAPSFNLTAEADQVTLSGESITLVDFATQVSAGATNETNQSLTFNITTSGDNIFSTSPQLSSEGVLTYAVAAGVTGVAIVSIVLQDDGGVTNGGSDRSAATTFTITAVSPDAQDAVAQVLVDTDDTGRISSRFAYDLTPAGDGTEVAMQLPENVVQRSEAAFDNLVGLYEIADPQGGIDTNGDGIADLSPENQAEYAEYVLNNRVDDFLIRAGSSGNPDRNTTVAQFGDVLLAGGKLYAPFVIANAGAVGFEGFQTLENNESDGIFNDAADVFNDRVMYFAFSAANPDNAEHLQSLGNNTFGFEDLPANLGISDNDFNDAIFQFTFASLG